MMFSSNVFSRYILLCISGGFLPLEPCVFFKVFLLVYGLIGCCNIAFPLSSHILGRVTVASSI